MNELLWNPTLSEIENSKAWEFIQEANKKFNISLEKFMTCINGHANVPILFGSYFGDILKTNVGKVLRRKLKS